MKKYFIFLLTLFGLNLWRPALGMENAYKKICDDCWVAIMFFLPQSTVVHTMSHVNKELNHCATVCINNRQKPVVATVTPKWFDKKLQVKKAYKKLQRCKNLSFKIKLEEMTLSHLITLLDRYRWKCDRGLFIYSGARLKNLLKTFKDNLYRIEFYNFYFKKFSHKEFLWLQKQISSMEQRNRALVVSMPHCGIWTSGIFQQHQNEIKEETIRLIESVGLPALSRDDWNIATKLTRVRFHQSCHMY